MNDKQPQHYSITLRLRRVTYEDAYINVPVTDDLLKKNEDDTYGINPELLWKEGIKLAGNLGVEWEFDEKSIEPHPIQRPIPENRNIFDVNKLNGEN